MSIQTNSEDTEQIRERLRKMSDLELRKYGRASRDMADPKNNFGPPNPSFQIQLNEARAEWRRRHPVNLGLLLVFGFAVLSLMSPPLVSYRPRDWLLSCGYYEFPLLLLVLKIDFIVIKCN